MKELLFSLLLLALPAMAQQPVVVGAVLPQTGYLADLASDFRKALLLWEEQVNAAGGLNGRRVELQLLDDRSESTGVGKLYEQLIREQRAELLIGPFGSAASLVAAATAERNRRVMVNATGASRIVHKSAFRYVFQCAVPFGVYGAGALELARAQGLKRLMLVARDDPIAREIAARTRDEALKQGFTAGEIVVYSPSMENFAPLVASARSSGAEAWIAFGQALDAIEMVKSFSRLGYAPRLFVAQGAAQPEFVTKLGQAAEYAVGIAPYDRRARTSGNAEFVQAYAKKWSAEPGPIAAEAYAAAKVLEEAVRRAGSLEQEKLREALSALEVETPVGHHKVDPSGAQLTARPLLTQVQRGRREIVWPEPYATAPLQPYPAWDARKPIK